jgi:hypothetical protein
MTVPRILDIMPGETAHTLHQDFITCHTGMFHLQDHSHGYVTLAVPTKSKSSHGCCSWID